MPNDVHHDMVALCFIPGTSLFEFIDHDSNIRVLNVKSSRTTYGPIVVYILMYIR